jgi:hypothetical protein
VLYPFFRFFFSFSELNSRNADSDEGLVKANAIFGWLHLVSALSIEPDVSSHASSESYTLDSVAEP